MPVITLLTDFGDTDAYVAEVKAVLVSRAPGATLVDINHQVPPGNLRTGQYFLSRAWPRFWPAATPSSLGAAGSSIKVIAANSNDRDSKFS